MICEHKECIYYKEDDKRHCSVIMYPPHSGCLMFEVVEKHEEVREKPKKYRNDDREWI